MNIDLFIKEIDDCVYCVDPSSIRIIVGKSLLSFDNQSNFEIVRKIDIYKRFGHCAFLVKNQRTRLNDSECCVWSLLLNIDTAKAKELLNIIKTRKMEDKLINWLYYKHGIVMINRQGYTKCFDIFKAKIVSHVLIISEYSHKSVLKSLNSKTKVAIVRHPSPKNWGLNEGTWIYHQDSFCIQAKYKGFLFDKASLSNFVVLNENTQFI